MIGISGQPSLTLDMVSGVRERWEKNTKLYESMFTNFAQIAESGLEALKNGDYKGLGHIMTMNHGLLSAIQVSSPALDRMVQISMDHGALGAKLTGAGGGGSIISLCDDNSENIIKGLTRHGFRALQVSV